MNESVFVFIGLQKLMNQFREDQSVCTVTSPASNWCKAEVPLGHFPLVHLLRQAVAYFLRQSCSRSLS